MNVIWLPLISVAACLVAIAAVLVDRKWKKNELSKSTYRKFKFILWISLILIASAMTFWFIIPFSNH